MNLARGATIVTALAAALVFAAPANADPDTDFANELHTYGIYGQKDYNAWMGKITCKRIWNGLDKDAYASAFFVSRQLQRGSTTEQAWQFLGAAIRTYCPENLPFLSAAAQPAPAPSADTQPNPAYGAETQ